MPSRQTSSADTGEERDRATRRPAVSELGSWTRRDPTRLPLLTIAAILITAIGAIAQLLDPDVLAALRRDPAALASGEWWRIASPLLGLDGNTWIHFATDAAGLLLVGAVVELRLGRLRWLALFMAGAIAGEIAGYAWDPTGAGASIALMGLVGGLVVTQALDRHVRLAASIFTLGMVGILGTVAALATLDASDTAGIVVGVIVVSVLINVLLVSRRRAHDPRFAPYFVAVVVVAGGLVLLASGDIHGAALLAGLATTVALTYSGSRRTATNSRPLDAPTGSPAGWEQDAGR